MAKKVLIELLSNPLDGHILKYDVKIDGNLIPNNINITFNNVVSTKDNVKIQPSKNETLIELFNVLNTFYDYSIVNYFVVGSTIEAFYNAENVTVVDITEPVSIDVSVFDISVDNTPTLKYFLEYRDTENIIYKVDIYKKGNVDTAKLIYGYATLESASVKDNLDPIRGSGLTLNLEASLDLNLQDLYTDEENQFTVQFYRESELLFNGFLKPDGVFQSFVSDRWMITLDCVDGLGILKDLAFVKPNGLQFVGKMKAIDIIYNCLIRTNLSMNLNTSVNIYYDGLEASDVLDPLTKIYLSVDRFVKTDKDTIMDCQEVLKSILTLFKANITQHNGQWYIYRSNELYDSSIVKFRQYSKTDNSYLGLNELDLNLNLGSQINGKYPHHVNANQQISIKGSVSAFRVNYKYGFESGLFNNPNLNRVGTDYLDWEELDMTNVSYDPLINSGLFINSSAGSGIGSAVLKSQSIGFVSGEKAKIVTRWRQDAYVLFGSLTTFQRIVFRVKQGAKYLRYNGVGTDNLITWTNVSTDYVNIMRYNTVFDNSTIEMPPFENNGDLTIEVLQWKDGVAYSAILSIDLVNISKDNEGAQGEFHTVQRQNRPSSIAKDTEEIFNGDSPSVIYKGGVFKEDKVTPTVIWFRRSQIESKPILQLIGEDVLRMAQRPAKLFSGDVYGYIPYLSVLSIDSVDGKFMLIEHNFNSKTNVTSCKFLEIMNERLTDIKYKFNLDYGSVQKTTITS